VKKSLWCVVLVIFAVAVVASGYHKTQTGAGFFLTNAYAQAPAHKAVPVKKAKLKVTKGEVTAIEDKILTVEIVKEGGPIAFTVEPKMLEGFEAVDKVMVTYETLSSGENKAVRIKRWETTP